MKQFLFSKINTSYLKNRHSGMSLLEIMLYITIAVGLIAAVMQTYKTLQEKTKKQETQNLVRTVKAGIDSFKVDIGRYPTKIDELINPPSDQNERRRWQDGYVPKESIRDGSVKDGYGNDLEYSYDPKINSYEIRSWGKNGPGSETGWIFAD